MPMPHHAANADPVAANQHTFLTAHSLADVSLHEVQGGAIPHVPQAAAAAVGSLLIGLLKQATADLAASDRPNLLILAFPRMVLAPPPSDLDRRDLPALLRSRALRLRNGEAEALWQESVWLSTEPSTAISAVQPEAYARTVTATAKWGSTARVFGCINKIPFAPHTSAVEALLLEKICTAPNPTLAAHANRTATLLPPARGCVSYKSLQDAGERIQHWTRRMSRMNPRGAPDGTGMRLTHMTFSADVAAAYAPWLDAIASHRTTLGFRGFLRTKTTRGQCKLQGGPDEEKRYPTTAAGIKKARPLSTHHIARRVAFGDDVPRIARAERRSLEPMGQYGLSPDGCSAAARKMQIISDTKPEWSHNMTDGVNAYGNLDRAFTAVELEKVATAPGAAPESARQEQHFHAFYMEGAGTTIIQVGRALHSWQQTNGIDQGCTHGNVHYNTSTTRGVVPRVQRAFSPTSFSVIHDDATSACPTVTFSALAPPTTFEETTALAIYLANDAARTSTALVAIAEPTADKPNPLPFAAIVFAHYALLMQTGPKVPMEIEKTVVYQRLGRRRLSTSDFISAYPTGTATSSTSYRLAGCFVAATQPDATAALADTRIAYDRAVTTFLSIPNLPKFLKLRALSSCCTPSMRFNHHLRGHPPSVTIPHAAASRQTYLHAVTEIFCLPANAFDHDSSSLTQIFLPATLGGSAVPCPISLAVPCFAASVIDNLPLLISDPVIGPIIANPASWASSPSPTLAEFAHCFQALTSLPSFRAGPSFNPSTHSRLTHAIFDPATGAYSVCRAIHAAGLHSQNVFSHATFKHSRDLLFAPGSSTPPHARARLLACGVPDATVLFNVTRITEQNDLTDLQATFHFCNHLGLHHPFITTAPGCHPNCPRVTPEEADNPLSARNHRLAYHHIACAAGGYLIGRHNDLAATIAAILTVEGGFICDLRRGLGSSLTGGEEVDIVASAWFRSAKPFAIDVTVSNPMLPTYIAAAMTDALAIFARREKEKVAKHGPGCKSMDREFAAAVFSTFGGLRGKDFLNLFAGIFAASIAADRRAGGSGWAAAQRKVQAREYIAATLARGSARMASLLPKGVDRPQAQRRPFAGIAQRPQSHHFF